MKSRFLASCLAGFGSGLVVLGIGGRILMRLLAFTTPEPPRFTWYGFFEIVALAAIWGLVTGPLILVAHARARRRRLVGPIFGLVVFALAAVPFLLYSGFSSTLVAPPTFLWLSALTFPLLFVLHGIVVNRLYRPGRRESGPPQGVLRGGGSRS